MSLRSFSSRLRVSTFLISVSLFGVGVAGGVAYADLAAVQTYTDQAVAPPTSAATDGRYDSPLAAGTPDAPGCS